MNINKKILHILEWIHPALLLAPGCPFLYVFYRERSDARILPLYLLGLLLVICTAASRTAARRIRSFQGYLGICILSLAGTLLLAGAIGRRLLGKTMAAALMAAIFVEGIWMILDAGRIHMREKRRKKAMEENDISWTDSAVLMEKPNWLWLFWFGAVYLAALLDNCPILCNLALSGGIVYLLIVCAYRQIESMERYLSDSESITHVPKQKIRRLQSGMLLASLLLIILCTIPSVLTIGRRTYQDLRYREITFSVPEEEMDIFFQEAFSEEEFPDWMKELEPAEVIEPPKWLEYLGMAVLFACTGVILFLILRSIGRYFLEFRGLPEENGDIAEDLAEDLTQKIRGQRRIFRLNPLSEREKIRRNYRKQIRRYRKVLPEAYEAPEEIEAKTAFPPDIAVKELHEIYEEARYGRE